MEEKNKVTEETKKSNTARYTLRWDMTDERQEPPDPLLEAIANVVSSEQPDWKGTASELLAVLQNEELQPNILTRKLNISSEHLLLDFNIRYASIREHDGRKITLKLLEQTDTEVTQ